MSRDKDNKEKGLSKLSGSDECYKVGHKKPPLHTRFQPGVSGNSRGRPWGGVGLRQKLEKELGKTIAVTKNGKPTRMTKADVIAQQIVSSAMKGDPKTAAMLMRMTQDGGAAETATKSAVMNIPFPDKDTIRHIIARAQRMVEEE